MTAQRDTISESGPHGPWKATVKVHALHLERARGSIHHETVFEVEASWTGPPAPGFPPSERPVAAHDVYVVDGDLELARGVSIAAIEALKRGGEPPDLRELATQIKQRLQAGPFG